MPCPAWIEHAPHQGHATDVHGRLETDPRNGARQTYGRPGAADSSHRHVRAEGTRVGSHAGPDHGGFHGRLETGERGTLLDPDPQDASAPVRREDTCTAKADREARHCRRHGGDPARERPLASPVDLADETQREVELLRPHWPHPFQGPESGGRARQFLAHR